MKCPEFLFFHARVVRRKLGKGPEWVPFRWEIIGKDDCIITGGIPTRRRTNGPRIGQWDWTGIPSEKCVVTRQELDAEMFRYEAESGNCSECFGDGQSWAGWSSESGHRWSPCGRCGATGKRAA